MKTVLLFDCIYVFTSIPLQALLVSDCNDFATLLLPINPPEVFRIFLNGPCSCRSHWS